MYAVMFGPGLVKLQSYLSYHLLIASSNAIIEIASPRPHSQRYDTQLALGEFGPIGSVRPRSYVDTLVKTELPKCEGLGFRGFCQGCRVYL